MNQEPYYMAYEKRYQAVFSAGAERWGHSPEDQVLYRTLEQWVDDNGLRGKRILEFACGEGACGVILSQLGCHYHGVDVSPTVIKKAEKALAGFSSASVQVMDMVRESLSETYDGALDCMGLHMLITDSDRRDYLRNAFSALVPGAPMLFFRESYRSDPTAIFRGEVSSLKQWEDITGCDYTTPVPRRTTMGDDDVEIMLPLLPARAKDTIGYREEMEKAGFQVESITEMPQSQAMITSASIYVRKPV